MKRFNFDNYEFWYRVLLFAVLIAVFGPIFHFMGWRYVGIKEHDELKARVEKLEKLHRQTPMDN